MCGLSGISMGRGMRICCSFCFITRASGTSFLGGYCGSSSPTSGLGARLYMPGMNTQPRSRNDQPLMQMSAFVQLDLPLKNSNKILVVIVICNSSQNLRTQSCSNNSHDFIRKNNRALVQATGGHPLAGGWHRQASQLSPGTLIGVVSCCSNTALCKYLALRL